MSVGGGRASIDDGCLAYTRPCARLAFGDGEAPRAALGSPRIVLAASLASDMQERTTCAGCRVMARATKLRHPHHPWDRCRQPARSNSVSARPSEPMPPRSAHSVRSSVGGRPSNAPWSGRSVPLSREIKADERAAARAHVEAQTEEAAELTQGHRCTRSGDRFSPWQGTEADPAAVLRKERRTFTPKEFGPRPWTSTAPDPAGLRASRPCVFVERLLPGHAKRHAARSGRRTSAWKKSGGSIRTVWPRWSGRAPNTNGRRRPSARKSMPTTSPPSGRRPGRTPTTTRPWWPMSVRS